MDLNLIRSLVTVAALAAFLGIVWWAYSPSRKKRLEDAGRSVLEENDQ
ncbi:MAG TPA: cbb3-type cytochrome c oxidase subunit 3 [Burkholderiales bacterium]|nr:cbb3-type cytochrome c oxidase subunit 3 [Burkholderiales bacterium]